MSKTKTIDLTSGPILKTLAELALPIMASSLLGTATILRTWHGSACWVPKPLPGWALGECTSGSHKGSWHFREWADRSMSHRPADAETMNRQGICRFRSATYILLGILFAAVCIVFIHPLLGFFNLGDAETYTAAKLYTLITCGLILFSFLNLTLTGLSTAQGDSKTPLMANLLGLVGNMILDPILILGFGPFPRLEVVWRCSCYRNLADTSSDRHADSDYAL